METILGNWKLTNSENFDEYMKEIGVNFAMRKIGGATKPNVRFELNGDEWTFTTTSTLKTHTIKYRLNTEFDEETLDGRKCRTVFTFENNQLVQTQKDASTGAVISTLTREITPEGHLRVVSEFFLF
jgi:fatty acid-binding protein 4